MGERLSGGNESKAFAAAWHAKRSRPVLAANYTARADMFARFAAMKGEQQRG